MPRKPKHPEFLPELVECFKAAKSKAGVDSPLSDDDLAVLASVAWDPERIARVPIAVEDPQEAKSEDVDPDWSARFAWIFARAPATAAKAFLAAHERAESIRHTAIWHARRAVRRILMRQSLDGALGKRKRPYDVQAITDEVIRTGGFRNITRQNITKAIGEEVRYSGLAEK